MSASPSIVVGVTGHRSFPEPERVAAAVDTVLGSFETAGPGVVVSALADGADGWWRGRHWRGRGGR